MEQQCRTLAIVGGASGVGKTTLLGAVSTLPRLNTGDFFKAHMKVTSRDDIRSTDWSKSEHLVAADLREAFCVGFRSNNAILLDTHYAAKLHGRNYRIGLAREHLFEMATAIINDIERSSGSIAVKIIHVETNPHALLLRRRLDTSRNRELVPSDCVTALSRNRVCSGQYLFEFARAIQRQGSGSHSVNLFRIQNDDFPIAKAMLQNILLEKDDAGVYLAD